MKIKNDRVIYFLADMLAIGFKGLFRTTRSSVYTEAGIDPYDPPADRRFIWSVWHDSVLIPAFARRPPRFTALASAHRDGRFTERMMNNCNLPFIRGSSSRGGAKALRGLITVSQRTDIAMTPDGPRGPARKIKPGIVYMASRCGNAIIPTSFASSREWRLKGSWTYQAIPKPFSKVILLMGQPIPIPKKLGRDDLQPYVELVQSEMDRLDVRAKLLAQGKVEPPIPCEKPVELACGSREVSAAAA